MPLYEYLCDACGRTIEAIQGFSEPPLTICDRCGGNVRRLLSAPAVQFKGSGWYVSDYGRGSSTGAEKKKSDAAESAVPAAPAEKPAPAASPAPEKKP